MYDAATGEHIYLSTGCLHDRHDRCRPQCEHCPQTCLCRCHYRRDTTMTEFVDNPATPDADQEPVVEPEQGEPVVEPEDEPVDDEDGEVGNPDDLTEDPGEDGTEDENADAGDDGDDPGVAEPDDPFAPENL